MERNQEKENYIMGSIQQRETKNSSTKTFTQKIEKGSEQKTQIQKINKNKNPTLLPSGTDKKNTIFYKKFKKKI